MKKAQTLEFIAKVATLLKEDKVEEAVAELETATETVEAEVETPEVKTPEVPEPTKEPEPTPEELEKSANTEKIIKSLGSLDEAKLENLVKWASICVDAQTIGELLTQFTELKDKLSKENVEKLFDTVEKLANTPIVKQDDDAGADKKSINKALCPVA